MNLSVKGMLKGMALCAALCAVTAMAEGEGGSGSTRTKWVDDSFEGVDAETPIGDYKPLTWGVGETFSVPRWVSQEGDESKIVTTGQDQVGYMGIRPMAEEDEGTAKHLSLKTEGTTLVRNLNMQVTGEGATAESFENAPISFETDPVYLDTLIKFTPADEDLEITDPDVQVAVYLNSDSNLVVYSGYDDGQNLTTTNSVISEIEINPEAWYRLTIKMVGISDGEISCFEIYLNGEALQHENTIDASSGLNPNGTLFYSAKAEQVQISQVSFQGTGALDELVLADAVNLGGTQAILLTLTWSDPLVTVMQDDAPLSTGAQIESGSFIDITVGGWNELESVTGETVSYNSETGEITGAPGDTATINTRLLTSGNVAVSGDNLLDGAKLALWASANDVSREDVEADLSWLDNYLLNVSTSTEATIAIKSIAVEGGTATITVGADVAEGGDAVDFGALNGTLVVLGTDDLSTGFQELTSEEFTITGEPGATATIEVEVSGVNFLRAQIKPDYVDEL